ncbi:HAD family phosphatase [Chloroflexi bacterium TSY]|nr:HAD family phosphatase [Chloroflexi bacterium TSY]
MLNRTISAILFDMDGLMLDTERMAQIAWQEAGAEWGYTFTPEIYLQAVGRTAQATGEIFRNIFGQDFPFDELYERKQQRFYAMLESSHIPTKPGLFELLNQIDELGLRKAVATSTGKQLALKKLTLTGLIDRFSIIVGGDEVPYGKPAPDIFLAAARRLDVSPDQCMVLEDSEAGIRAAHAAGMAPIMVPDLKPPSAEVASLAYRVLPSLDKVSALIK